MQHGGLSSKHTHSGSSWAEVWFFACIEHSLIDRAGYRVVAISVSLYGQEASVEETDLRLCMLA